MPTISNQSPAPGSNIRPTDVITFTVTGADPYGLALYYPDGTYEILWDGTVFAPFYLLNSSRSGGPTVWNFSILRTGGWKQAPTVTFVANGTAAFNTAAPLSVSGNPAVLSIAAASSSAAGSMSAADKAFEDSLHAAPVNLTDADATLLWSTSASYNMPTNTQTALRTLTIGVSDSPPTDAIMRIGVYFQSAAQTRIVNGGGGGGTTNNLQGAQATYWYRFNGTNWGLYFPQGLYPLASTTYSGLMASAQATMLPGAQTGAIAGSRYVGATGSGAPVAGTFTLGDFIVDQTAAFWICTAGGTPGTWARVGLTSTQSSALSAYIAQPITTYSSGSPTLVAGNPESYYRLTGTVTAPTFAAAASTFLGQRIVVKMVNLSGISVGIHAASGDLIDGAASYAMPGLYGSACFLAVTTNVIDALPGAS